MKDLEHRIRRGTAWTGVASVAVALADVITLVLLLRFWVTPAELGIATLAVSLFPVLDLLGEMGMPAALVQRAERDEDVISSVFWLHLAVATAVTALVAVLAPLLGRFHGHPVVGSMLIAYGIKLLLQVGSGVPLALLRQDLRFREISIIRVGANLTDVTTRIIVAAVGFPVWCFAAGQLACGLVTTVGAHVVRPWRPRLVFQRHAAASCLAFGFKMSAGQLLTQFFSNVDYQVVGRFFGTAALAIYRVAFDLVLYAVHFVSNITVDVAFPSLARLKADPARLADQFLRFARQNLILTLPVVALILVGADEMLALIFPDYAAAATAARVLCVVGLLRGMSLVWMPLNDGIGSPGSNVRYAAVASILLPVLFVAAAAVLGDRMGILSVALAWAVGYPLVAGLLAQIGLWRLGRSWRWYLGGMAPLWGCAVAALVPAVLVLRLLPGWPAAARLVAAAACIAATFALCVRAVAPR